MTAPPSTETPRHTSSGSETAIVFWYKNYKGEQGYRRAVPISIRYGTSDYHHAPQWLMLAFDTEKEAEREFAMADMSHNVLGDQIVLRFVSVAQGAPDQRLTEDMTLAHNARKTAIEECARELETSYPDHAWLNAACAAIRALSAVTPSPGSGEPDSAFMMQEVLDFLNSIEGAGYGGMASFEIVRGYVRDLAVPSTPRCTCQPLTRYAGDEHDPDCAMTSTQSGGAAK